MAAEKLPRFQVDLIDHEAVVRVLPDLVCPICQDILLDPVETEKCRHSFCRDCIASWLLKKSTCPSDNSPLTSAQVRSISESNPGEYRRSMYCTLHHRHHHDLQYDFLLCWFDVSIAFSNLRVRCPLYADKGCSWQGSYPDMESHIRTNCIVHPSSCDYCSSTMPRGNLALHRASCASRPSQCPHCETPMPFTSITHHIATSCVKTPIQCVMIPGM
jgi:hypothetical protein